VSNHVDPKEVLDLVGHAAAGEMYFGDFDTKQLGVYYSLLDERFNSGLRFGGSGSRENCSFCNSLRSRKMRIRVTTVSPK
jgi:hypothetical protein